MRYQVELLLFVGILSRNFISITFSCYAVLTISHLLAAEAAICQESSSLFAVIAFFYQIFSPISAAQLHEPSTQAVSV